MLKMLTIAVIPLIVKSHAVLLQEGPRLGSYVKLKAKNKNKYSVSLVRFVLFFLIVM
jgi:hypothetical protein